MGGQGNPSERSDGGNGAGGGKGASESTTRRVGVVARAPGSRKGGDTVTGTLFDSPPTRSTPRTKGVVRKPQQDGGLANTRIADEQKLEQMVIVVRLWCECGCASVGVVAGAAARGTGNVCERKVKYRTLGEDAQQRWATNESDTWVSEV